MRKLFQITLLFLLTVDMTLAALTSDDVLQIQKIVRDEVTASEGRLNQRIDDKYNLIVAGIGLIVLLFGVPQFYSWLVETRRTRREMSEIAELKKRIEQLETKLKT
jgi:hypothetical protein